MSKYFLSLIYKITGFLGLKVIEKKNIREKSMMYKCPWIREFYLVPPPSSPETQYIVVGLLKGSRKNMILNDRATK